ncbi:probable molt-inhibiting hormone [Palaemon carinicauda]|uniref:probable molt-inhibiting hormone n=1 Tax=Palaemon carinicauda TaxID=392227 RepID=UPI0035B5A236
MLCKGLTFSAVATFVLVLCLGCVSSAPSSASSSSSSPALLRNLANGRMVAKRHYGSSCQGFQFSKALYKKVDEVCDECTNLYRKPYIKEACRTDCFVNDVFEKCLEVLMHDAEEFLIIRSAIADY